MTVTELRRQPSVPPAGVAPGRLFVRIARWFNAQSIVFLLTSLIVAYLVLVPVGTLVVASLRSNFLGFGAPSTWTLNNFIDNLGNSTFLGVLGTSLQYSILTTLVSTVVGMVLAWLYVRTNTPAKWFALLASVVPLIIPGLIDAAAWVLLLSPRTGPVNIVLHQVGLPEIPVYSMASMVLVQSLHMIPLSFLMGMSIIGSMDRSLEEAAAISGAAPRRVLRSIVLPIMRPGVLGSALLVFVLTMSSFEVPQLIGVPAHRWVLTTQMFNATTQFPARYGTVSALGMVVLAVAMIGLYLSRRLGGSGVATVTGKGFRPTTIDLGRWRWAGFAFVALFGLLGVVLPVATLVWSSLLPVYENPSISALHKIGLDNYRSIFRTPNILHATENTLIIAVLTGVITTALCVVIGYIVSKSKVRGRRLLEMLATAPVALPSVILGISLLYWYESGSMPLHLYGSVALLVIAFVTGALPFSLRFLEPAFAQISIELEEAAANSGARPLQTFLHIYLPLLRPAVTASFLYCFVIAVKELTAALFLYSPRSQVLSVSMYSSWLVGDYTVVCAIGVVMLAVLAVAVTVVRLVSGRGHARGRSGRTAGPAVDAPVPVVV
jgi:iron(III) transport system permease protein